MKNFVDAGVSF